MKRFITLGKKLAFSQTAKDTYLVMTANVVNGITGLLFTVLVARFLTVAEFGTFSSLLNLTLIVVGLADLGMTQGVVNFLPPFLDKGQEAKVKHYLGNMLGTVGLMAVSASLILFVLPGGWVMKIAGTSNRIYLGLAILGITGLSLHLYILGVFQAYKKFLAWSLTEIALAVVRVISVAILVFKGLTVGKAVSGLIFGVLASFLVIWRFWPAGRIHVQFSFATLRKIFRFSRWLWFVNMIINVYGRMDVLLLTALTSSVIVGQYAAAARLALVFPLAVNSLNAVVAPRFASFPDVSSMVSYSKKAGLLVLGIASGLAVFFFLAKPIILVVYGSRYLSAVPLFQGLVLANLPLVLTIPATNGLVYFFKRPQIVTGISAFQLTVMAVLTWVFIPHLIGQAPVLGFTVANGLGLVLMYGFWWRFYLRSKHETA
jgi:O-antigen/teichoic acid export membrane protein